MLKFLEKQEGTEISVSCDRFAMFLGFGVFSNSYCQISLEYESSSVGTRAWKWRKKSVTTFPSKIQKEE